MKKKVIAASAVAAALLVAPALAQTRTSAADHPVGEDKQIQMPTDPTNPPNPNLTGTGSLKKAQRNRGGSASPTSSQQNSSGVRARQDPSAGTSADTSYHTITNDVQPSNGRIPTMSGGQTGVSSPSTTSPTISGRQSNPVVPDAMDKTALPESMRIQQQTERSDPPPAELITKGGTPTVVNSPVERNRLDTAAPSRERLQIDDTQAQQQNPSAAASIGTSSNGASTGNSGVTGSPIRSGTVGGSRPSSSGGVSGASSHSSGGSSSSGGH